MGESRRTDTDKERRWQKVIREAARSGLSVREFCRRRELRESQFYWWQHKLKAHRQTRTLNRRGRGAGDASSASFALVSEGAEELDAGIELVLGNGRRLRIRKGVDEATLRTVLAVAEAESC